MTDQGNDRDWQTYAGITVVALAAAVMSFAAWFKLGELVGITQTWTPEPDAPTFRLAWLLPLSVDVYAVTTARVWLRSTTASAKTRAFARMSSLAAIGMSLAGNALLHFIVAVNMTSWSWWPLVVVAVSGIPALQLGLALHLAALVGRDRGDAPDTAPDDSAATSATSPVLVAVDPHPLMSIDQVWAEADKATARKRPERRANSRPAKRAARTANSTASKRTRRPSLTDEEAATALLAEHPVSNPAKRDTAELVGVRFDRVEAIHALADEKRAAASNLAPVAAS